MRQPQATAITLERLALAHGRLARGEPLPPEEARLAAVALGQVLERLGRACASALAQEGLRQRNAAIRELAARHLAGHTSTAAQARALIELAKCYRGGEWRHHRHLASCPADLIGTPRGLLWRALKAHPSFPTSVRMVELILA